MKMDNQLLEAWLAEHTIYCERLNGRFNPSQCPQRSYACDGCPRAGKKPAVDRQRVVSAGHRKPLKKNRENSRWPREEMDTTPPEILEPTIAVTVQLLEFGRYV